MRNLQHRTRAKTEGKESPFIVASVHDSRNDHHLLGRSLTQIDPQHQRRSRERHSTIRNVTPVDLSATQQHSPDSIDTESRGLSSIKNTALLLLVVPPLRTHRRLMYFIHNSSLMTCYDATPTESFSATSHFCG